MPAKAAQEAPSRFRTNPETAADVDALSEKLRECPIGQTIPYADLSAVIGRDVQANRHVLDCAREAVEADTGSLFEAVRGTGIRRLPADEVPDVGLASIRKIRRTARRTINRLDGVRVNDMTEPQARKVIAHKSQLGAIALVADGRKSVSLVQEIAETGKTIPAGRVLDIFKS